MIMKTKKTSTTSGSYVSKKTFILTLVCGFLAMSTVTMVSVFALYVRLVTKEDESSISKTSYMIKEAVDGLYREVPIASYTNSYFIDEAKLTFTQLNDVDLVYRYDPAYEESAEIITLSDQRLINSASMQVFIQPKVEDALEKVPLLQSCARLYAITFTEDSPAYSNYNLIKSKLLQDKRTAYVWKSADPACSNVDYFDAHLLEVIESVGSY
jgi:hypothetical protein